MNGKEIIEKGLDFILSHFNQDKLFPRTIMTRKFGYQKEVFSKNEVLQFFEESDFIDCRINAFPSYTAYKGIQRYPPDLIFIDLDATDLKSFSSLNLALNKTLKNIKEKFDSNNAHPTVLWSGNGYHIILPVYCPIELERIQEFQEFDNPSERFLRFAKDYLSNNKVDKSNYPSFRSCLLRIPNSYNGKCLARGETLENSKVKIIQTWDKTRPSIQILLYDFRRYLITLKIKQMNKEKDTKKAKQYSYSYKQNNDINTTNTIPWIEKLLKTPILDFRKNSVNLILAPYLINTKKLSYQESFDILISWLQICDLIKKLDFNPGYLVKAALKTAIQKGIPPMKRQTLENRNEDLYHILQKL